MPFSEIMNNNEVFAHKVEYGSKYWFFGVIVHFESGNSQISLLALFAQNRSDAVDKYNINSQLIIVLTVDGESMK